jgi:hypothetical protein
MSQKPPIERIYNAFERDLKRLWEHANAASHVLAIAKPAIEARFPNLRSYAPKQMSGAAVLDSAKHMRERLLWEWCLIIAITLFDGWLESTIDEIHCEFSSLTLPKKEYDPSRPTFNVKFFADDLSGVGMSFSGPVEITIRNRLYKVAHELFDFLAWKEVRNSLVHGGRRATKSCAAYKRFSEGSRITLTPSEAREALAATLTLARSIRNQIRTQMKRLRRRTMKPGRF